MGKTKDKVIKAMVGNLSHIGQQIIDKELESVSYNHDTYNLHDSYGWCVYVGGKIEAMGFVEPQNASKKKKWYGNELSGRDEIKKLFQARYKPTSYIELVVGVAMPYGMILEEKMKYEVFAVAASSVEQAAKRIKGARYERIRMK